MKSAAQMHVSIQRMITRQKIKILHIQNGGQMAAIWNIVIWLHLHELLSG